MDINFTCLSFKQLSLRQLYELLALRIEVFVVEQNCPYQDVDGKDQQSMHLLGYSNEGALIAYVRLLPKGISYEDYPSIGRVVISKEARGKGLGRPLMLKAIEVLQEHFGKSPIKLSAQSHLQEYYQSLGFETVGDGYLEDGIPHIAMIKSST